MQSGFGVNFWFGPANFRKIASEFRGKFLQRFFSANFSALFLQGFRPLKKYTPKIVGSPLQSHFLEPKPFSRRFSADPHPDQEKALFVRERHSGPWSGHAHSSTVCATLACKRGQWHILQSAALRSLKWSNAGSTWIKSSFQKSPFSRDSRGPPECGRQRRIGPYSREFRDFRDSCSEKTAFVMTPSLIKES